MLKNLKVYLASGWFTPEQLRSRNLIRDYLKNDNIKFFNPEEDCPIKLSAGSSLSDKQKVFDEDVRAIDECDVVIVNTADMDTGTVFEYGYAYAKKKIIVYYNDVEADQSKKRNLMLAMSADYHAKNIDDLDKIFSESVNPNPEGNEEVE